MKWIKRAPSVLAVTLLIGAIIFFGVLPGYVGDSLNPVVNQPPYAIDAQAAELHDTLVVTDLHADSLLWNRDLLKRGYGQVDIPRLIDANVAIQAFTVVTKSPKGLNIEGNSADAFDNITLLAVSQRWPIATWTSLKARALHQAARLHTFAERSEGRLSIIKTVPELDRFLEARAKNPEQVAGFLGIEGLHCLEGDLKNIDTLYDAGFRMMGLTHFFDNEVAGSAHGEERGGLTDLGRQVVTAMEAKNILIDLAHLAPAAIDEVLAMATKPLVVSHTGVRGTCDNQRNLADEHIKAIAKGGGVIGIGVWETATCGTDATAVAQAMKYTADLAGVDHVALGSDHDGSVTAPYDITGVPLITQALLEVGFTNQDIAKIMGQNTIRLLRKSLPPE